MIELKVAQKVHKGSLKILVHRYKVGIYVKHIREFNTTRLVCRDTPNLKGKTREIPNEPLRSKWKPTRLNWEDLVVLDKNEASMRKPKPFLPAMDSPVIKQVILEYDALKKGMENSNEKLPGQLYSIFTEPTPDSNNDSQSYVDRTNLESLAEDMNDLEELFYDKSNNWGVEPTFEKPDDDLLMVLNSNFKPGDIVSLSENLSIVLLVTKLNMLTMDRQGKMRVVRGPNIDFHFPGALQTDFCVEYIKEVQGDQSVNDFLEGKDVKQFFPVAFQLLKHINSKAFEFEMQRHFDLLQIYDNVALPKDYHEFNIKNLTTDMLKRPATLPELFGMYSFFLRQFGKYDLNREKRNTFVAYPKHLVDLIPKVTQSARDQDTKFKLFMAKVTKLIDYRRGKYDLKYFGDTIAADSPAYFPSKVDFKAKTNLATINLSDALIKFTADDKMFIEAIWNYVVIDKIASSTSLVHLVAAVLKPLGYPYVSCTYAHNFLKDIGVAKPWQNLNLMHRDNQLPPLPNPETTNKVQDAHQHIRHDFGNLPVYTIDDEGAQEIDDGISIQKEEDGSYWIHVHIADPTTVIEHDSALATRCLAQPMTGYLPETSFPMLPKEITHGICSLGGENTDHKLTLSFSAKVSTDGTILDYKIRAGKIRKVISIRYDDVDISFNHSPAVVLKGSHPAKYDFKPMGSKVEIDANTKQDLQKLFDLTASFHERRIRDGRLLFDQHELDLTVKPNPLPNTTTFVHQKPNYSNYDQLPLIKYRLLRYDPLSARGMVAQAMTIAGCVASSYCQAHNLPALYTTQKKPDFSELPAIQKLLEELTLIKKAIPYTSYINLRGYLSPSLTKTQSGEHHTMGLPNGYIRVTSPLRRAVDLLMHWQIKNHLLYPDRPPLFSTEKFNQMLAKIGVGAYYLSRLEQRSQKFWLLSLLQRFEVDAKLDGAALMQRYPHFVKRIQPETQVRLVNGSFRTSPAQPVYTARVTQFHFDNKSWRVLLEPFGTPFTFRANMAIRPENFEASENDFQPNQQIEVVVASLLRDNNTLLFVEPFDTKL